MPAIRNNRRLNNYAIRHLVERLAVVWFVMMCAQVQRGSCFDLLLFVMTAACSKLQQDGGLTYLYRSRFDSVDVHFSESVFAWKSYCSRIT